VLRVLEIAEDGRHLARERGFLVVSEGGTELGRLPLDDLAAVIASAHGLTYSNTLLVALAERNVPFVFTGPNHMPVGFLWPADGHHQQAGRIADQAYAPRPVKKRLWARLVAAKIAGQGQALRHLGKPAEGFPLLARQVRSGDPDNLEAQAARRYWPLLFGSDFRRDREAGGLNGMLNYGYAVLRAGTARAVMASGLHPSLGIGHVRRTNAFGLVDDLMEPFRPVVDLQVHRLAEAGARAVTPEVKRALAGLLITDLETPQGLTPVGVCLERLAYSFAACLAGETRDLNLPTRWTPFMS